MFDHFDWQPMYATFCDLFLKLILEGPLLMHCHPFDCAHIQCCNYCDVAANAHVYPTARVNN